MPLNLEIYTPPEITANATSQPTYGGNDPSFDEMVSMLAAKGEAFEVKEADASRFEGGKKIELAKCHNIDHARDGKMAIWREGGKWCGHCFGGDCQGNWGFRQWSAKVFPESAEPPLAITDELRIARYIVGKHTHDGVVAIKFFNGDYYVWDGHYRRFDDQSACGMIYTLAKEFVMGEQLRRNETRVANGEKPESAPPVGKMLCANIDLALRTLISVAAKGWHDKRPGRFIAFADSILDLDQWIAGKVAYVDQTPEYFDPNALNYALEYTDAEPSVFLAMLREQFSAREIAAFQEFGGYCFTDENDIQRMLGIFGPPRSGKGTMERTLQASIGRHNTVAKSFDSFVSAHALEDVVGKTLLVLSDTRPDPKVSRAGVERLLGISGQDTMNINPKNRKHFDADLICKILIMANLLPDFSDASGALLARFMFLQTTKSFVGQEDSELLSKILREQNAIAWWFLRGLRRLLTNGRYTEPDNQLREKFEAKNNPVPTFVGMQCEVTGKSDDKLQPGDLFNAFEEWAIPFEVAPMSENVFFRELYRYFPTVNRTHGYIRGITLKDSEPMDGQLLDAHLMANAA